MLFGDLVSCQHPASLPRISDAASDFSQVAHFLNGVFLATWSSLADKDMLPSVIRKKGGARRQEARREELNRAISSELTPGLRAIRCAAIITPL
jgi:hypothetical protein